MWENNLWEILSIIWKTILEEEKTKNPNQLLKESQLLKMLKVKNIYLQLQEQYLRAHWDNDVQI